MKKTIYRYLPVCLCLFFWFLLGPGCTQEKEDLGESEDSIELPNVAERFFRQSVNNQTLSAWIKKYRSMMADSTRLDKLCSYAECYGYPQWNDYFFTYTDAGYLFAVPVIKVYGQVECLWFFEKKETDYFAFSTQRKKEGYIDRFDWLYDYLALKMYGSNDKDIINISPSTRAMRCNDIYTGYKDKEGEVHLTYSYTYCWDDGIGGSSGQVFERDDMGGPHHNEKVDWLAPGEGGGGGGSLSGNIKIIKAKKIFRNSKMTDDDWATLEDLINKIMETCMGENLYNGLVKILDGKTYVIEITNKKGSSFRLDGGKSGIYLSEKFDIAHLFHEMIHAYQVYNETYESYKEAKLNLEIEAYYAQYLYIMKKSEYDKYNWGKSFKTNKRLRTIAYLNKYIDEKGALMSGKSAFDLESYILNYIRPAFNLSTYSTYEYNYDRSALQNFKNLNKITINC